MKLLAFLAATVLVANLVAFGVVLWIVVHDHTEISTPLADEAEAWLEAQT
jgi:hypothetical protein